MIDKMPAFIIYLVIQSNDCCVTPHFWNRHFVTGAIVQPVKIKLYEDFTQSTGRGYEGEV